MTHKVQIDNVVREATPDEMAAIEARHAKSLAQQAEIEQKLAAKNSALTKLAALGLTDAEVSALIGA